MAVKTKKYVRKPLFVEAVRVNQHNINDVAQWCDSVIEVDTQTRNPYVRVPVNQPKNIRHSKAFMGDWVLFSTDKGYTTYTNKAFLAAFDPSREATEEELKAAFARSESEKMTRSETPAERAGRLEKEKQDQILANRENMAEEVPVDADPSYKTTRPEYEAPAVTELDDQSEPAVNVDAEIKRQLVENAAELAGFQTPQGEDVTLEPATPQGIADVVAENQKAQEEDRAHWILRTNGQEPDPSTGELPSASEVAAVRAQHQTPQQAEHAVEKPVASEPKSHVGSGDTAPPPEPPIAPQKTEAVPVTPEQAAAAAAASPEARDYSPRVLSIAEQEAMTPDELKEAIMDGAVLAQEVNPS